MVAAAFRIYKADQCPETSHGKIKMFINCDLELSLKSNNL